MWLVLEFVACRGLKEQNFGKLRINFLSCAVCADLKGFKGREKTSITIMCHSKTITKTEGNDDATAEQLAVIGSSLVLQQQQQQKHGAIAAVSDGTPSAAVVEKETSAAASAAAAASSGSFSWKLRKTAAVVGTGTSTAQLHEEQDLQSRQPGRRLLGQALKKVQRKQSYGRIRKLPSQQQKQPSLQNFKAPVIIHTYSPKTIHTEPEHFMSLVQKLTGSSHTRLRLADNKQLCGSYTSSMSSCLGGCTENKIDACLLQQQDVVSELLLQPELCNSSFVSESSAQYCSPSSPAASSSSEEEDQYSRFPCNSGQVAKMNMQTLLQCDDELSPKGPLPSYGGGHELLQEYVDAGGSYEFLNPSIFFSVSSAFDQLQAATNPSSVAAAKREPLSPGTLSSFSDGLTFSFAGADMVTLDAAPSASTSCNNIGTSTTCKFGLPQRSHELHHQDDHMMSLNSGAAAFGGCSGTDQSSCIDAAAGLSYTNFASTVPAETFNELMADILLPTAQLSPASSAAMSWSSSFFQLPECFNTSSPSDSSPALPFSHIAYSPTPGNMLSLRDIEAALYIDDLLRG